MTYSILVYDASSNKLGIGVVSGSIAVGSRVPWGRGGLGVVATQGYTNPVLARVILNYLERGFSAEKALMNALKQDPEPECRQVAVLSVRYGVAVYTGKNVPVEKKWIIGDNYVGIGNLLSNKVVIDKLISAYRRVTGAIEEKILKSLLAASHAGGDARGDKSSAILIFGENSVFKGYDKLIDLRVDYSDNPVRDLIYLYNLYKEKYV